MKTLKTGIAGLDEFLQGGLLPGIFLLIGSPEAGAEVFARQVAYSRAKNSQVTYFTLWKTIDNIREEMKMFGWNTSELEREGKWRFKNKQDPRTLTDSVLAEIDSNRCVVIDSLSELFFFEENVKPWRLLRALLNRKNDYVEAHLMLLTQGMQASETEVATQHFAENVLEFTASWSAVTPSKNVVLKKSRGAIFSPRKLLHSIGRSGFRIETATRIT